MFMARELIKESGTPTECDVSAPKYLEEKRSPVS
jgi:hypothetical protein